MVTKYPARSPEKRPDPVVYLAGGPGDIVPLEINGIIAADFIRDRDIVAMSQRGTMFSEPALTCVVARRVRQRTSRPPLLFRGDQACAFGSDGSLPPRTHRHRRRPQRLQFDRERRRFRRPPQGARLCKRGMSTGLPMAPTLRRRSCATTRRASAASSSIRSCRRPTTSPKTGGMRAPASTISSRLARRNRPATPPIPVSNKPSPD